MYSKIPKFTVYFAGIIFYFYQSFVSLSASNLNRSVSKCPEIAHPYMPFEPKFVRYLFSAFSILIHATLFAQLCLCAVLKIPSSIPCSTIKCRSSSKSFSFILVIFTFGSLDNPRGLGSSRFCPLQLCPLPTLGLSLPPASLKLPATPSLPLPSTTTTAKTQTKTTTTKTSPPPPLPRRYTKNWIPKSLDKYLNNSDIDLRTKQ